MTAVITMPLDPVLRLGPIPVHWYGVAYAIAFFVGIRLVTPYLLRRGISQNDCNSLFWWNIAIGLLGGRLYFVLQQPDLVHRYLLDPIRIIAVWDGGMAFFGAIIACLATTALLAHRRRLPLWLVLDGGALFATLPQAIGRVGNVINGDILGAPSNLPWALRYTSPHTFAPSTTIAYQPANVYELLTSLALFGVISFVLARRARPGTAVIVYIACYALSQFLVFFARATEPTILLGLKQAQVTALVVLLIGVPSMVLIRQLLLNVWRTPSGVSGPAGDDATPVAVGA
jgi:phosphatidylglycerol---prolipoprotein diacylglyceryl transferase